MSNPEFQIGVFRLVMTCGACPEQYDVYRNGEQVAYFRLRHGTFRVDVPNAAGKTIFEVCPEGDGAFTNFERGRWLRKALRAVEEHYMNDALKIEPDQEEDDDDV
jgi:hypothetical protein